MITWGRISARRRFVASALRRSRSRRSVIWCSSVPPPRAAVRARPMNPPLPVTRMPPTAVILWLPLRAVNAARRLRARVTGADHVRPDDAHVELCGAQGAKRVGRRAHDRLVAIVERGVEDHRHPGQLAEAP